MRPSDQTFRKFAILATLRDEFFDLVKFARNKSPYLGNCDFLSKILRLREQKVWSHWMCHVPSPHFLDPVPRDHDPVVGAVLRGRGHQLHRVGLAHLGQVAPYRLPVNKYELALQNKFLVQCCLPPLAWLHATPPETTSLRGPSPHIPVSSQKTSPRCNRWQMCLEQAY